MKSYKAARRELRIDPLKDSDDAQAYVTHYLHNLKTPAADKYIDRASVYLSGNRLLRDQTPLLWDIPFPPHARPSFTFIDLFAGVGGFRIAFQRAGGRCVFSSEIDRYAKQTYEANFGEVPFGDITKISEKDIPDHDILCGGFPCQPFSIAGVSKKKSMGRKHGFEDETKGTLFFDIKRIIQEKMPKAFLLENVKNLTSHDRGKTFEVIRSTLEDSGYRVFFEVLDGKYYVPQHRERIFIVGFRKDLYPESLTFSFPECQKEQRLRSILDSKVDDKYTLSDKLWNYLQRYAEKHKAQGNGFGFGLADPDGISRTISARYYKDGSEILIAQPGKNPRRLTPRECARLQGFPEEFIIPVSDTQSYKQFGNAVVVPLVTAIAKEVALTMQQYEMINRIHVSQHLERLGADQNATAAQAI